MTQQDSSRQEGEARRVALVRRLGLLDTAPEERFDVFVRLAASVTGAPISTLSLIDQNRVWFKAARGLPDGVREVPREIAACAHVLGCGEEEVLVIPDATQDPRTRESPLVTGPFGLRFYAGVPLRAPGGEVLGSLCVIDRVPRSADAAMMRALRDIAVGVSSALRIHEMAELALKDTLTGLGNRRMFEAAAAEMLASAPSAGRAVGLLLLDLDRFKAFNETLGHAGGDAILREVGLRLALGIRDSDLAARLGGDEFAVLVSLPDRAEVGQDLLQLAARMLQALRDAPVMIEGQALRVQGSVGIAFASRLAPGATEFDQAALMRGADVALYNAKRGGRNRVATARCGPRMGIGSKNTLAADLRAALAAGGAGLSLVLQPVRSARDGTTIRALEALVRWTHPEFGPISPGDFVPVAERTGLAAALDSWVLREACRLPRRFRGGPQPVIAVNITPSFLSTPDFLEVVDRALAESGLPAQRLCLEMTERVLLFDKEATRVATEALHARGVQVALDDFGAGHASFGSLADVPFSKIKMDGSLIGALGEASPAADRAAAILQGVAVMAGGLGLKVVAEGVETAEQFRRVRALGFDEVQGWHVGRPDAPEAWLQQAPEPQAAE